MKGTFGGIIAASKEWTKTVLFKPFSVKKWIMLFIIALFAMQIQGGCGLNLDLSPDGPGQESTQRLKEELTGIKNNIEQRFRSGRALDARTKTMLAVAALLTLILILLTVWFYSVFAFVFIDAIASNEYGLKKLFARNKTPGNSFFGLNMAFTAAVAGLAAIMWRTGFFSLLRSPAYRGYFFLAIMTLALAGAFLAVLINDFALIVMYKKRLPALKALRVSAGLVLAHARDFIRYVFVKIGLHIVTAILGGVAALVTVLGLAVPIAVIIGSFALLYKVSPGPFNIIFMVIGGLVGVPLVVTAILLSKAVLLPFAVFLRTFNIKFVARLNKGYDLFNLKTSRGAV